MNVYVVGSVRGAPGVTTTALLLASAINGAVMVEAELDGGVVAVRYGLGREPGMTTYAAARPADAAGWRHHAQDAGGVPVLVGPDAPESAAALWARAGEQLAGSLAACDAPIVADVGRLRPHLASAPLLSVACVVVVLVRPTTEDLVGLSHRLPALRRHAGEVAVVPVGRGPYRPGDIAAEFGVPVLGVLPEDRRAVAMLTGGGGSVRALARTRLARAAASVADAVSSIGAGPTFTAHAPTTANPRKEP